MPRLYLHPDTLQDVSTDGLTPDQVRKAIGDRCRDERIATATAQAAKLLQEAGIEVDADSLKRLRKLVE